MSRYSLGIEVEGADQIYLSERSSHSMFSKQLATTTWFEIHLSNTGEEEHANMAIYTIESILINQILTFLRCWQREDIPS
ncbi:hypothetical protein Cylst_0996 [Cylindrospermum stagnale PCC 7417]|uniref:Uncharacterized protein n=1 Tax=Cylindrospermum stagnale PCC 7417 TaxID=56107 RepID=K9WSX3_9NOST|nr:hypothetical protein [Cylindrospermum stagnale]AFZ23318.1 hypothetical protein Cylst_0996 [Cylindrospermum stagnale PCC 7417]